MNMGLLGNDLLDNINYIVEEGFKFAWEITEDQYVVIENISFSLLEEDDPPFCTVVVRYKLSYEDRQRELELEIFLDRPIEFNVGFVANKFWELWEDE